MLLVRAYHMGGSASDRMEAAEVEIQVRGATYSIVAQGDGLHIALKRELSPSMWVQPIGTGAITVRPG